MQHLTNKYERSMYMADVLPEFREEEIAKGQARAAAQAQQAKTQASQTDLDPWWALIDMNSYFATLEQQSNPFLRGKPVGIVKDVGRSCIIAASKEAKKLGVKTGCALRDARLLAPNIVTVPADFDKYFYTTKVLKDIFESLSPDVDVFSLDEAFINLTHCRSLYPTPESFFENARQKVHDQLGEWVTFSLGLGQNRLQAKLASEFSKPDNWFEIHSENLQGCLAEAKVEDICGIGFALTAKLHNLGIMHPFQLNFYEDEFLIQHFGRFWGPELRRIGQGKNSHLLDLVEKPLTHMKSVGRSKTLFKATADPTYIRQMIYNLAEDMCFKARRMKLAGQHVYLSLRDTQGNWFGNELRFQTYLSHTTEVFQLLDRIFHSLPWENTPIIKVSVRLSHLKPLAEIPICWLPDWQKQEKAFAAVDKVNQKYGLYTVKAGTLAGFKILMPEVTGFLGDKTYQFGDYPA